MYFPFEHGDSPASYVSFRANRFFFHIGPTDLCIFPHKQEVHYLGSSAPNSDDPFAPVVFVSGGFCFGSQEIGKKDRPKDQQKWLQTSSRHPRDHRSIW